MNLIAENLTFGYPGKVLGENVNFCLAPGGINYLIGCNGCGKSTLLKTLAGYLMPQTGKVLLEGVLVSKYPHRVRARHIGVLWQNINSNLDFSVREMIEIIASPRLEVSGMQLVDQKKAMEKLSAQFGLEELLGCCFGKLSGGEKQRTLLAGLLLLAPDVLLLDEPTSALDPNWRNLVVELLEEYARKHTVLTVTHDLELIARARAMVLMPGSGKEFHCGNAEEIITGELLGKVYNAPAVIERSAGGRKRIYFD